MSVDCSPAALVDAAKCIQSCLHPGAQIPALISLFCTIANNPSGGTSALTNTHIFVGNAANVATDVAMSGDATIANTGAVTLANSATTRSHLGLGTADTPQFARLGLGVAAGATTPLTVLRNNAGNTEIGSFDDTTGNPFITVGTTAVDGGSFWLYDRLANKFSFSVHGHSPAFVGDSSGNLEVTNNINCAGYQTNANPGLSQTFDTGIGNTQIQFLGGIAILIA